jgi:hypothetical protein
MTLRDGRVEAAGLALTREEGAKGIKVEGYTFSVSQ